MILVPLRHPIELWDESRNANNAIEMAMRGHWLTPTFAWISDHWNTKPPLFIWVVAALERMGIPSLVAMRLPSSLSALAVVALVYTFCSKVLGRPFVAIVAAITMMSSTLFFGQHVAMTGDYDAMLSFFTTLYCLGFFCYVESVRPDDVLAPSSSKALLVAAAALILAIMTKGIAGVLLLPGLFFYISVRGRLLSVLKDRRFWLALLAVAGVTFLYYKGRDMVDPGYLKAVWENELGGRYSKANEGHHARTLYYANYLVHHFVPGIFLFVLGFFSLRKTAGASPVEDRSRAAVIFNAIVSITLLLVLTKSATKISYYAAPALPLMSICGAIGLADLANRFASPRSGNARLSIGAVQTAIASALLLLLCVTLYFGLRDSSRNSGGRPALYGETLKQMAQRGVSGPILLLDPGFTTNANFQQYDPIADYYAKDATRHGIPVTVQHTLDPIPDQTWLVSCDDGMAAEVTMKHLLASPETLANGCVYGKSVR